MKKLLNIFEQESFFGILQTAVASNQQRGYRTKLATAAECQPAYLSQVLRRNANLTTEQAHRLCVFWQLDDSETEYTLLLHQIERTDSRDLGDFLHRRASQLREEFGTLARRIGAEPGATLKDHDRCRYYSSWHYAAVHMLATIPYFQNEITVSQRLGLPLERVEQIIDDLCQMQLMQRTGKTVKVLELDLHIDEKHPLHVNNHLLWRGHCLSQLQGGDSSALHYTAVHSLSKSDVEKIKSILLGAIRASRDLVVTSPEEDAIVVLVDCYRLQK